MTRGWRWMDAVTGALLVGAGALVVVAAAPALLRNAGVGVEPRTVPTLVHIGEARRAPPPPEPGFVFGHEDDDEESDDLMRAYPDAPWTDRRERNDDAQSDSPAPRRIGITRAPVQLDDEPDGKAQAIVARGEPVVLLREQGEWVLVMHGSAGMGWVKRSQIAIR